MNQSHFKLGLFVTASVGLLVLMLLLLGVFERLRPSVTMETYFFEPVEGLERGAAVKFRGIPFGRVSRIGFAHLKYRAETGSPQGPMETTVFVEMVIEAALLDRLEVEDIRTQLADSVKQGLRAQLTSSGLGGPTFIQIDFLDPAQFPVPDLDWAPEHLFIPSAPSTIRTILDSLVTMLTEIDESELVEKMSALAGIGPELNRLIDQLEKSDTLATADASLRELQAASEKLLEVLSDPRLDALFDDTSTTLDRFRAFLDEGTEEVHALVSELTTMSNSLETAATSADELIATVETTELLSTLRSMAEQLGPAGYELRALAVHLEQLVQGNENQIDDTIRSLRRAVLQLESLLEDAEANPSRMIFGDPPPRHTPGDAP